MNANLNTNDSSLNQFEKNLLKKHTYKGYMEFYKGFYEYSNVLAIGFIVASGFFSVKAFESILAFSGDYAIILAVIIAIILSSVTYMLTDKVLIYQHEHKTTEPMTTTLLVVFIAVSIWADLKGAPEYAKMFIGESPKSEHVEKLHSTFNPQIEQLTKEIEAIEGRELHWCNTHNKAHKCEYSTYYAQKSDAKHIQKIEDLTAKRNELLSTQNNAIATAQSNHDKQVNEHESNLETAKSGLRGGTIFLNILFLMISWFRFDYGVKASAELKSRIAQTAVSVQTIAPVQAVQYIAPTPDPIVPVPTPSNEPTHKVTNEPLKPTIETPKATAETPKATSEDLGKLIPFSITNKGRVLWKGKATK